MVGVAGSAFAFPGDAPAPGGRAAGLPDGSAAKGMITPEADRAIESGLACLNARRNRDGSFGTNPYYGNVAVTSLGALAFMAGGHLPGRGVYGRVVDRRAARFVLRARRTSSGGKPGFLHNPGAARRTAPCTATASARSSSPKCTAWSTTAACATRFAASFTRPFP